MGRKRRVKPKIPFKPGDLVTGKDRSYMRSIYKMLSTTEDIEYGLFEFQSLGTDCVERWKDHNSQVSTYQMYRHYSEFRRATKKELLESFKTKARYYLLKIMRRTGIITHF